MLKRIATIMATGVFALSASTSSGQLQTNTLVLDGEGATLLAIPSVSPGEDLTIEITNVPPSDRETVYRPLQAP